MDRVRPIELLRWICVLPAAGVGGAAVQSLGRNVNRFVLSGWGAQSGSSVPFSLQLCVYAFSAAAFVLAGGWMAPRCRVQTALVMAILGTVLSLLKHILLQAHPGVVNYLHLSAETLGGVVAAVWMFSRKRGVCDADS